MKVGLIGAGRVGQKRAHHLVDTGTGELSLVSDAVPEREAEIAETFGASIADGWQEVVNNPEIDVVIVSASNDLHAPVSIAALESGKDVLCEKPLARTAAESRTVWEAVNRTGQTLKTGFNHRHYGNVMRAKDLVGSDELGELLWMRCRYGHSGSGAISHNPWFTDTSLSGGGTFLDNGVHALDICRWFMGDFAEATGFVDTAHWHDISPVEDNGFGVFRTEKGRVATLHASWTQWKNIFSVEIGLDKAILEINGQEHLTITLRENNDTYSIDREHFEVDYDESFKLDWLEFVAARNEGRPPLADARDGWKAVEMAEAVYESSKNGRTIKLSDS